MSTSGGSGGGGGAPTSYAGALTANVTAAGGSYVTWITTPSLTVGKWMLFAEAVVKDTSGLANAAVLLVQGGTATITQAGPQYPEVPISANSYGLVVLLQVVDVTAAGTLAIQVTAGQNATVLALAPTLSGTAQPSGYTVFTVS